MPSPPSRLRPRAPLLLATAAVVLAALPGCGRSYESDPRRLLEEARSAVDSTAALHFALSSSNASGGSTYISGGEGDAKRPNLFAGSFQVSISGVAIPLQVNSSGGVFKVRLPFGGSWEQADPSKYGFSDPGQLIDPQRGLSNLLSRAASASLADRDRLQGEELYEVEVTLPGDLVKALLTDADPSQPVHGTVGIDVDSHEVRRVVLSGPLLEKGRQSTYTVRLTGYGESVTITPPPG